ncbi:MAG: SDR family NAD(P)-dependent oxidoreductase [Hormoscilla sp.]
MFLITEDSMGVAAVVASTLDQKGAQTVIIRSAELQQPEKLAEIVNSRGPVNGIVHLAPLSPMMMPEKLSDWRSHTSGQVKSLFGLLQLSSPTKVLAASLLGGHFGRRGDCGPGLPTGGSSNGLLKTLVAERPGVDAKAIDFDNKLDANTIAKHICQELMLPGDFPGRVGTAHQTEGKMLPEDFQRRVGTAHQTGVKENWGRVEIGYPQGKRTVFDTVPAPRTEKEIQLSPSADWVILVTGGARGITAEIAKDLAAYGITMIVVGRSPYPRKENAETAGIKDVASLRKVLLQQARKQGLSSTPVQIERQIWGIRRDRAILRNLESFRKAGARVEYRAADVRNESEFGLLINDIYERYDRLDAVIHGAGIIEDKLIPDKTPASFDRVFDTKADSAFILAQHVRPETLKLLVFFTSIAGTFGNRGQSDYAAANEVVNRLAWQLDSKWEKTRVVAINWGPWDTTGMASAEVKRKFREQGVIPIPLEAGRQFFIDEMLYGKKGEMEIIAGDGPWDGRIQNGNTATGKAKQQLPFLGERTPQIQPDGAIILEHTFSLDRDPYLGDHRLDGKPVVPATVALEWLAEVVQAGWPDWTVTGVRDLRVLRGLVLETQAGRNVIFKARAATHADASCLTVTAEMIDPVGKIPFYRAEIVLEPEIGEYRDGRTVSLSSGMQIEPKIAYQDYLFHGPSFHLVTAIDRLNERGIDAVVKASDPQEWLPSQDMGMTSKWLFDPGLMDTGPQMAMVWTRVQRDTSSLPSRVGAVTRYRSSRLPSKALQLAFRVSQVSDHSITYDAIFYDENGMVHFYMQDIESTSSPKLNRLAIAL